MESLSNRLQKLVDIHANGKHSVFAKLTGIPQSTFRNYVNGRIPHIEHLIKIRDTFRINIDWLITGDGEIYLDIINFHEPNFIEGTFLINEKSISQENIFQKIENGGFVVIDKLVDNTGNLDKFHTIIINATRDTNISIIQNHIIETLGEKPKKSLEIKARQLMNLIEVKNLLNKTVIVVIFHAHLLSRKTLIMLKGIMKMGVIDELRVGFVLIGDIKMINEIQQNEK